MIKLDPYQLFRCLFAGGPGLARPFDVDDPLAPIPIQPTMTTWALPKPPASGIWPVGPNETFDQALDRLAYKNRLPRAELDDSVFKIREKHWRLNGGGNREPFFATDASIIELLTIGFTFAGADDEARNQ